MKRQKIRKLILLVSFAFFPITVIYLSPAPPIMSLKASVINLSVIVLFSVVVSGFFFRRSFCGWVCPGAGCQLVSTALNDNPVQQKKMNLVRVIMVAVWAGMLAATAIMAGITRVDVGFPGVGRFAESVIRYYLPYIPVVMFMFIFVTLLGRRGFCHRGCWIAPVIAATTFVGRRLHVPSLHIQTGRKEECTSCAKCTRNCPMSIDVQSIVQDGSAFPNNCVQCGTCVDICSKDVLKMAFSRLSTPREEAS